MFNPLEREVIINGKVNGAATMIKQRYENLDKAVEAFISAYRRHIDINNDEVQDEILEKYNLSDATVDELDYIARQVRRRV